MHAPDTTVSTCVICDRALPPVRGGSRPAAGFCAECAAELEMVPVEDLATLTAEETDRLPFGYISLDRDGRVSRYNRYEARLSGLDPRDVIGRDFFGEVAPCASVRAFGGQYHELLREGRAGVRRFRFLFRFRTGERLVQIFLTYMPQREEALIIVRELASI